MSVRIMTAAWATSLPAGDKLVLLALADCANDEGHCWPGLATLCEKTGRCRRSLQESLRALDAAGHLSREENPGKGMNYTIHPVAKSATGANLTTGAKPATPRSKTCHPPVAKSAPKPSVKRKEPSPPKIAHELPIEWEPQEFAVGSESRKVVDGWPPGELAVQLEMFKAQHGKKGDRFFDWQKAWSTWVLNTRKFGIGNNGGRTNGMGRYQPDDGLSPTTRAAVAVFGSASARQQ